MKFNILGFSQKALIENSLSVEDALILRTIKDLYSSATMEFIIDNGVKFVWINYTFLQAQLPIAGDKRTLKRKIERYGKNYLILRIVRTVKDGKKGNFAYVSPTEKLDLLEDLDLRSELTPPLRSELTPPLGQSCPNKDTSIRDTSIKVTKEKIYKKEMEFKKSLEPYKEKYSRELLVSFSKYWTEKNKKGVMRFEKQDFFEVGKRLATFKKNENKGFSKNNYIKEEDKIEF